MIQLNRLYSGLKYRLKEMRPVKFPGADSEFLSSIFRSEDYIRANQNRSLDFLFAEGKEDAVAKLRENGIVLIRPRPESSDLLESIERIVRQVEDQCTGVGVNLTTVDVVSGETDPNKLARSKRSVANIRVGADQGMIDIWHFNLASPEADSLKDDLLGMDLQEIMEGALDGIALQFRNMNCYINRSVTHTRGLHVDSYGVNQFKAFVYLTDVQSLADGPYCYGVGSHRMQDLEPTNRWLTRHLGRDQTDILLADRESVLPMIAPKGTVIISNQSAVHRGFPQEEGHFRALGVMNFVEKI